MPVPFPLRCVAGAAMSSTVAFLLGVSLTWRPVLALPSTSPGVLPKPHQLASTAPPSAMSGCGERVHDRLFFGLGTPDGIVSDDVWVRFLAEIVTPRFPNGLTVVDASGQWRALGEQHVTIEPSRVVEITHDDSPETNRHIREVVAIYKRQYRQHSVMLTRARIEACF